MSGTNSSSISLTTSLFTTTITSGSTTSESTSTITTSSIFSTSIPPSTTIVIPSSTSVDVPSSTTVVAVTSTIVQTPTNAAGSTQPPVILTITSTLPAPSVETPTFTPSSSSSSTSASSTPSALSASGSGSKGSGGLTTGATIAIAVIIPIVAIAALILFGLWFWRRRKARKNAEEERKNEMAEYGFNPNNDPTLAPAAATYADEGSEGQEDNTGYRGWGATSSNRKASTTLGSNNRPVGQAVSDSGSQPSGYYNGSPNTTGQASEAYSADPLMHTHPENGDGIGELGGTAAATGATTGAGLARNRSGHNGDMKRGPSNASSAYSNGRAPSEASSDRPDLPTNYYQEEVPYNIYNDAQPGHGPYGDGSYGGNGQPVIRDVQARRNTRIERAPTMPQTQGGIAQNF